MGFKIVSRYYRITQPYSVCKVELVLRHIVQHTDTSVEFLIVKLSNAFSEQSPIVQSKWSYLLSEYTHYCAGLQVQPL